VARATARIIACEPPRTQTRSGRADGVAVGATDNTSSFFRLASKKTIIKDKENELAKIGEKGQNSQPLSPGVFENSFTDHNDLCF